MFDNSSIMASFVNVKDVDQRTKDIVNWYIRQCQLSLPKHKGTINNISEGIINIILLFYYVQLQFDNENHGNYLIFTSDGQTVQKTDHDGKWSTCLYGDTITAKKCNRFDVHIKLVEISSRITNGFHRTSSPFDFLQK